MKNKLLIILPTLNEKKNIKKLLSKFLTLNILFDILIIDDGSEDNTISAAKSFVNNFKKKNIKIIFKLRKKRYGIGNAHKFGIKYGYKNDYKFVITMDSDLAHDPKYVPIIIKKMNSNVDLVVGSKHLKKNLAKNWSFFRVFLSKSSYFFTKLLFNHKFDSTNSFRCYNLKSIDKNFIKFCKSDDYDFFFTSMAILTHYKYNIKQFAMTIYGREDGNSKMLFFHIFKSVIMIFIIFIKIKLFTK